MSDELFENFENLEVSEINSSIVSYLKEIHEVKADVKAYSSAARDAVKDLESRIATALAVLKKKAGPELPVAE